MDFFLDQNNLLILTVAALSGTMLMIGGMRKGKGASEISVQEAVKLVNQQNGIFLDIRTSDSFQKGNIPQSRNIPRADLQAKSGSLPKNKPIIVVCDSGQQAAVAVRSLRKEGFDQAVALQGGLRSWNQEGLPLTKKR